MRMIQKFIRPEDFERPCDINSQALASSYRELARTQLQVEQYDSLAAQASVRVVALQKRIARLEELMQAGGGGPTL